MSHSRFFAVLLALLVTAGCKAQSTSPAGSDPALNRRIEVTIRSQFNLPVDYSIAIGARKSSTITGYDELPVTIARGAKAQVVTFLISSDGKKLARLETFDLTRDPAAGIDIAGRPVRGNPDAKVTVVNFDDLECPYCARMHQSLFPATMAHYKDKVRFVYKDFPLAELHPWAIHAAIDANCLAAQNSDAYWSYVDYLHSHGEEVTGQDRDVTKSYAALDRIARQEAAVDKLDTTRLDACLSKQDQAEISESLKEAAVLGLEGAPTLFVNGERVNGGAVPQEQLWMVIDRALRAEGEEPPAAAAPAPPATKPAGGK